MDWSGKERIMNNALPKKSEAYTYGDYCHWEDDRRWELINGVPYLMSPGPNRIHQGLLGKLHLQFAAYLENKTCEVYLAPFDIRLPEKGEADEYVTTVVQPDLMVYCDLSKLDEKGGRGAPDLLIEILSPSTTIRDQRVKLDLYERHGVREYWVVHPNDRLVYVYLLKEDGRYPKPQVYSAEDKLPVAILPDLEIDLARVFPVERKE